MLAVLMSVGKPVACTAMNSMRGIYALGDPRRPIPERVAQKTYVDGLALRYFWDDLEPQDGTFNWSRIDRDIQLARSYRKKVSLSITAGIHTPTWVYASGAASFKFMGRTGSGPSGCGAGVVPVPWDPVFLAKGTFSCALWAAGMDRTPS